MVRRIAEAASFSAPSDSETSFANYNKILQCAGPPARSGRCCRPMKTSAHYHHSHHVRGCGSRRPTPHSPRMCPAPRSTSPHPMILSERPEVHNHHSKSPMARLDWKPDCSTLDLTWRRCLCGSWFFCARVGALGHTQRLREVSVYAGVAFAPCDFSPGRHAKWRQAASSSSPAAIQSREAVHPSSGLHVEEISLPPPLRRQQPHVAGGVLVDGQRAADGGGAAGRDPGRDATKMS